MKRIGDLWSGVTSWDNLLLAYRKARRGKRTRPAVVDFTLNLERELLHLQDELISGEYRPGAYRLFTLYERKPRQIAAAPFRDRVVHHAVMNLIEPPLDRRFIHDSYACRRGKGVHAAVDRYQALAASCDYVLKLDISRYFASIDHAVLKTILAQRIKDRRVIALLNVIIDGSPAVQVPQPFYPGDDLVSLSERRSGIPIGNLTSQFFANLYLDDFDHWLKEHLKVPGYLRYVDDLFLLASDKEVLRQAQVEIARYLMGLRLRYNPKKVELRRVTERVDVLGYQVSRHRRWLRNDNGYRARRRLNRISEAFARGDLEWDDVHARLQSWIGHALHGESLGLRRAMFSAVSLRREQAVD